VELHRGLIVHVEVGKTRSMMRSDCDAVLMLVPLFQAPSSRQANNRQVAEVRVRDWNVDAGFDRVTLEGLSLSRATHV
jgi:hypothetical protein